MSIITVSGTLANGTWAKDVAKGTGKVLKIFDHDEQTLERKQVAPTHGDAAVLGTTL
jgi:hypothetical protein